MSTFSAQDCFYGDKKLFCLFILFHFLKVVTLTLYFNGAAMDIFGKGKSHWNETLVIKCINAYFLILLLKFEKAGWTLSERKSEGIVKSKRLFILY